MKKFVLPLLIAAVVVLVFGMEACRKADRAIATPSGLQFPATWPQPAINIFEGNQPTIEGIQLGRKLFYDGRLSRDGNYPCASCHQRKAAFGTFDHDRAHGYNNSHTLRNAPPLFNLAWMREFNWEGAYKDIPSRILAHITDTTEMAGNMPDILTKLNQDAEYRRMFSNAFGHTYPLQNTITPDRIAKALTQFVGQMISSNSKYDKVKAGTASFTDLESDGYTIFKSQCAGCHTEPLFTNSLHYNTGFANDPFLNDKGRLFVTKLPGDSLKFRVPSLRNLDYTYPYIHDGRVYTLAGMIDHYSTGVITGPTTEATLLNKPPLTSIETTRLLQFLKTLNDSSFLSNPAYGPN